MVNASELEACVRGACGTWTRAEFKEYLKTTKLSATERRNELRTFCASEKQLRELCASECYSCSADVLSCLRSNDIQSCVDLHNRSLRAGAAAVEKKKKKNNNKKKKKTKKKADKLERRTTEESKPHSGAVWSEKNSRGGPQIIHQCPTWDTKKNCVTNGFKNDKCVLEENVIGYGRSQLSDGQCYSQKDLQEWVKNHKESPVTSQAYTNGDLKIIKSPMKEDEKVVVQSLTSTVLKQFTVGLVAWKQSTKTMADATSSDVKTQAAKMGIGAAVGAAAAAFFTPVGAIVGAIGGAAMAFDWLRNHMISKGIDLVVWIVKNPKTAMMFLFIVKQFIKAACKEAAKTFSYDTYARNSKFQQYVGSAKGMLGTIAEGGNMSMGTLMRAATSGETWKSIWRNGGDFCATAVASAIPGGALVKSGASMIVNGCVGCAEEASRTGIELAAYQKDIKTGTRYVGDILTLVLNPRQCMMDNGLVQYASCGELVFNERACRDATECRYTAPVGRTIPSKCEEACGDIGDKNRCGTASSCKWYGTKCKAKGWFSGGADDDLVSTMTSEEASVVGRQEKQRILATERSSGAKNVRARRRLNTFVQRRQREDM